MQSHSSAASSSGRPPSHGNTFENALQIFRTGNPKGIVVVDGVIDPEKLRQLAEASSLDTRLLEPGTTKVRTVMLASRPLEFLVVRFISIGRYIDDARNVINQSLGKRIRDRVAENLTQFEEQAQSTESLNGYIRTRGVKFYGQAYFTVEQRALFLEHSKLETSTARGVRLSNSKSWAGLLLNDAGGRQLLSPPWIVFEPHFRKAEFLPSTRRTFASHATSKSGFGQGHAETREGTEQQQTTTSDPRQRPRPFDLRDISQASPLHFAAGLLTESALNWSQFIEFLRSHMLRNLPMQGELEGLPSDRTAEKNRNITESLRLLRQARAHLADAVKYFDETQRFWNVAIQGAENQTHLSSVSSDFQDLTKKAIDISNLCKEEIDTINSYMSLQSSFESLHEGKLVKRLTYIGIIYAAMSLSCGIFGMNVTGLGGDVPWYYFLVVAAALILAVATSDCIFSLIRRIQFGMAGFTRA